MGSLLIQFPVWLIAHLGRFLKAGYSEVRGLLASSTPHRVKRAFTGSLVALLLALGVVIFLGSQIHPLAVALAVTCVFLIAYQRRLFRRMGLFLGYFLAGFLIFVLAGLILVVPLEKNYPLLAKAIGVALFVLFCVLIPGLLAVRRGAVGHEGSIGSGDNGVRVPTVRFADVGGLEGAKKQIRDLVRANLNSRRSNAYSVLRNGILLHGPRGTGKTFLAEATAGEFKLNYLCVSAASLIGRYVGATEANIQATFETAKAKTPALLFIDEIDAVGTRRQQLGDADDTGGAARSYNSTAIRLMECVSEYRKHPGLIIMAATNLYDGLDRALIREGRFDLPIRLDLPNEEERERIFETQLAKRPWRQFQLKVFAKRTPGWSAAKIRTLVDRAATLASDQHRQIEEHDLDRALKDTGGKDRPHFRPVEWNDIVLSPSTEADLRNLIRLMDPPFAEKLGVPMPSGLLLLGPPGTGKTMVARLIATQTERSFYPITAADVLGSATGASVKKLTELFARAKDNSPSIIFLDEMDGLLPWNTGYQAQHDIQFVEQARTLISDLEPGHNVFLIGTTNHVDNIDPAILRGGRFSEKIEISVPDKAGYGRLMDKHLSGIRLDRSLSVDELVERLNGVSPADLEAICNSAMRVSMNRMAEGTEQLPPLIWDDFAEAMRRVQVRFS
jgi:transitional endoplasmic reticulum ATPase